MTDTDPSDADVTLSKKGLCSDLGAVPVEELLALADEWDEDSTDEYVRFDQEGNESAFGRSSSLKRCADELREVISEYE